MAKRQRYVYPTDRIAHLWAHQTQDSARNAAHNFYFTGDTIYSYGGHFPVARIVTHKRKRAVFFTTRDYSVTTSGHKNLVRSAIPRSELAVFHVVDPSCTLKQARQEYLDRVAEARKELAASRNKIQRAKRFLTLDHAIDAANQFLEYWGYKPRLALADYFSPHEIAELASNETAVAAAKRERDAKADERRRERWAKRNAEWQKREEERQAAEAAFEAKREKYAQRWREGDNLEWWMKQKLPTMLRINGDNVETSKGVEFPLDHARRALPVVKALLDNGRTYQRNGHTIHLGHYALDRIDEQGTIYAGCHIVPREEVERLIAVLNGSPAANDSVAAQR